MGVIHSLWSCCPCLEGFPGGFLLPAEFLATSEHIPSPSPVPGGIASESLTFTPLEDMIFLKWEEPVEPNGLITQYEVHRGWMLHPHGTQGGPVGYLRQLLLLAVEIKGRWSIASSLLEQGPACVHPGPRGVCP